VLIVGAGPTGLMLACQLAIRRIPFRIIDKASGPTTQSQALAVQARTLEIFAQMGIAEAAVARGVPAKAISFLLRDKPLVRFALEGFGQGLTPFPFLLMLEQSQTEALLLEFLTQHGQTVEWNTELVTFTQDAHEVRATVAHPDQGRAEVHAAWLVGADGAHSSVLHILGIPFVGKTYQQSFFLLDCRVDWPMLPDEMYAVLAGRTSFAAFFPLTDGRCRVVGMLPEGLAERDEVAFDDIVPDFTACLELDITLSDPQWISVYRAHHRCVAAFRVGRCFLAGDAAHIHSPVGAQGMNTGLQDAYNLAWKLALVSQGRAHQALLETYNTERLPIARRLVRTTDRAFTVVTKTDRLARTARTRVMPWVLPLVDRVIRLGPVARLAFTTVSQIGLHYRGSPLSQPSPPHHFPRRAPKPGERLPYVGYTQADGTPATTHELLREPTFHLLVLAGHGVERDDAQRLVENVGHRYGPLIAVHLIPAAPGTARLYARFGVRTAGYFLVRPDGYLACRSASLDGHSLAEYLHGILAQN
jgi:2-polyprenyl-6-methoxyphenol hydroxylase-like FAD-dependent oxidoreductase